MAKPIRATPSLRGEEANKFVCKMIELDRSKISSLDRKIVIEIKKNAAFFIAN